MVVIQHERARFWVESHGERRFVDLLVHRGNGACDCFHFLTRLKPEIGKDGWKPGDATRCPHIKAARGYLLDMFIEQLRKQFKDGEIET